MKKTLLTLCCLAAASFVAAQAPVVVEPKSQRQAATTTSTTSSTYSSYSSSNYYDDSYRERANRWALGLNFNTATHNPVWAFGLGANLQYYPTDAFRVEASYNGYLRRHYWASWDINLNLHYLIEVAEKLEIYPLVGVTFNHAKFRVDKEDSQDHNEHSENFGKFGVNLGGGIQYSFNDHLFVKAEGYWKYAPERTLPLEMQLAADTETNFGQRAIIQAGIGYRF